MEEFDFGKMRRLVVKVGSSLLNEDEGVNYGYIEQLGKQLQGVKKNCPEVILVSSGAVAAGVTSLGWGKQPHDHNDLQVAAAVGQFYLLHAYHEILSAQGFRLAQYLITTGDLADRLTFLNSRTTLRRFLELGLLPIVNENDALVVNTRHLRNNDHFAAEIANLVEADLLIVLTDVDGIYSDFDKKILLSEASATDPDLYTYVRHKKSKVGSGGMQSKIDAARLAATAGVHTVITSGANFQSFADFQGNKKLPGTLLRAPGSRLSSRARWLANSASPGGAVIIDQGAAASLSKRCNSLLPIGITDVTGNFRRGDVIEIKNDVGVTVARGMSNYDAKEVTKLCRRHSNEIKEILGFMVAEEVVHRDNMVTIDQLT